MSAAASANVPWSIVARNLPEHATNPIHTDAGAQAVGFERALVAGVTTYSYCVHPLAVALGMEWVAKGTTTVAFRSPVFDGETVSFPVRADDADGEPGDGVVLEVRAPRSDKPLVFVRAQRNSAQPDDDAILPAGEPLTTITTRLDGEFGSSYAQRAGDDLTLFEDHGIVHPAVWPVLANRIFHEQLANGSWIHTKSTIRHHATAPVGSIATVRSVLTDTFVKSGLRAVARVLVEVDGRLIAAIDHEAIIDVNVR